eukprot:3023406-Amphidinium_carterae.1
MLQGLLMTANGSFFSVDICSVPSQKVLGKLEEAALAHRCWVHLRRPRAFLETPARPSQVTEYLELST